MGLAQNNLRIDMSQYPQPDRGAHQTGREHMARHDGNCVFIHRHG